MALSCGLLMYRGGGSSLEVLLVHPGGPLFAKKDAGHWSVPKGLPEPGEPDLDAARREFEEETSFSSDAAVHHPLGEIRQKGGKLVRAWAFEGNCDPAALRSNEFELEWPPRSGRRQSFPEVDRAGWFTVADARERILPAQEPFLDRLLDHLGAGSGG